MQPVPEVRLSRMWVSEMNSLGAIPPSGQTAADQAAAVDSVVSQLNTLAVTFQGANDPSGAQILQSQAASLQAVSNWLKAMPAASTPSTPAGTAITLPTIGPGTMTPAPVASTGPTPAQAAGIGSALGLGVGLVAGLALGRKR